MGYDNRLAGAIEMKKCLICDTEIQRHKDKRRDKRLCCSGNCKMKNWRRHNPERNKQNTAKWIATHQERYKDYKRKSDRKYYLNNKEKVQESQRVWRENNREKWNFNGQRYKARKKGAQGNHTFQDWTSLREKNQFCCLVCDRREPEIKLTEDHVIPLSRGGTDYIWNIQPLCRKCNSKKHNKILFL